MKGAKRRGVKRREEGQKRNQQAVSPENWMIMTIRIKEEYNPG